MRVGSDAFLCHLPSLCPSDERRRRIELEARVTASAKALHAAALATDTLPAPLSDRWRLDSGAVENGQGEGEGSGRDGRGGSAGRPLFELWEGDGRQRRQAPCGPYGQGLFESPRAGGGWEGGWEDWGARWARESVESDSETFAAAAKAAEEAIAESRREVGSHPLARGKDMALTLT